MEEIVGRWWHNAITRLAHARYPEAAVQLDDVQKAIGILFRAAGGSHALRLAPSTEQHSGGYRSVLQRIAGSGQRADMAQLEPEVLALPASIAIFDDRQLNYDLYLWLAIHAACFCPSGHWLRDNQHATQQALTHFPGFAARHARLLEAHLQQRGKAARLNGKARLAEEQVQSVLRGGVVSADLEPDAVAPVWLWINARIPADTLPARNQNATEEETPRANQVEDGKRRRTNKVTEEDRRNPFVLPFRAESLMTWSELIKVNRSTDDEEDGNALTAANDMDKLAIAPTGRPWRRASSSTWICPAAVPTTAPWDPASPCPSGTSTRANCCPSTVRCRS